MERTIDTLRRAGDYTAINDLIPYARSVGLEVLRDEDGLLTVLRFRETNIGNYVMRSIHGGVVGGLLEHAAILHLVADGGLEMMPRIINLSIDYLRPCAAADTFARGEVIKQGRRVANVRVRAWQTDPGKPVAAAHAHFLLA